MKDPSEHLFRREAGRIVPTLTRIFGVHNLGLVEDAVQDTFCRALEVWKYRGVPENPSAWLLTTAKNRAINILRRELTAHTFAPELRRLLDSVRTLAPTVEELFTANSIQEDQLRMMFSCCYPQLSQETQAALILHLLCGFSIDEIADAIVIRHPAIEKRIVHAKKMLTTSKKLFDVAVGDEFTRRLPIVYGALYFLFKEGYRADSSNTSVRIELCQEAMRLTSVLLKHPLGKTPATYALAALMRHDVSQEQSVSMCR